MKVYFEGFAYDNHLIDKRVLNYFVDLDGEKSLTEYVGYYNQFEGSPIFILPKIFLPVFGEGNDGLIASIALNGLDEVNLSGSTVTRSFISKFSFIFYLSLIKFLKRKPDTLLAANGSLFSVALNKSIHNTTELEIVLALENFYHKHKDLLLFKQQEKSVNDLSCVNWQKTIRNGSPVIFEGNTIYTNLQGKEEEVDFSNELIVVYFSLLNYFSSRFGKRFNIDQRYKLLSHKNYASFVRSSRKILKKLKGRHFDDRLIHLSKLLQAYFELYSPSLARSFKEEKLLIRGYNIVFEDMIDLLLSDEVVVPELKLQKDGKVVDHIYRYDSLFEDEFIYYIGDSKYYKESTGFSRNAKYKQFTYAKNVIHYNIDPFNDAETINYRDEITEGYNLTPNFFINGFIKDSNLRQPSPDFIVDTRERSSESICHFSNRVFDRDTLYLCSFKVNFLFVIQSYVIEKKSSIKEFRSSTYSTIRTHFIDEYNRRYDFYTVTPHDGVESFLNIMFRKLLGKAYRSSVDRRNGTLTVGLLNDAAYSDENNNLLSDIRRYAAVESYRLG